MKLYLNKKGSLNDTNPFKPPKTDRPTGYSPLLCRHRGQRSQLRPWSLSYFPWQGVSRSPYSQEKNQKQAISDHESVPQQESGKDFLLYMEFFLNFQYLPIKLNSQNSWVFFFFQCHNLWIFTWGVWVKTSSKNSSWKLKRCQKNFVIKFERKGSGYQF